MDDIHLLCVMRTVVQCDARKLTPLWRARRGFWGLRLNLQPKRGAVRANSGLDRAWGGNGPTCTQAEPNLPRQGRSLRLPDVRCPPLRRCCTPCLCPAQDVLSQLAKSFISLETYVPSSVVRYLTAGNNPRNLQAVSTGVVMLATDICSFTPLSEKCSLTEVWVICNTFIDACTSAIVNERGEVIKLIGDCVTAYFPPENADGAVAACKEIVRFALP